MAWPMIGKSPGSYRPTGFLSPPMHNLSRSSSPSRRRWLTMSWNPKTDVWSSSPLEEQMLCAAPRIHYGRAREIVVFFNRDPSSPEMRVHVQPYRSREMSDDSTMTVDFPREMVPSHEQMQKWAEDQIVRDHSTDFYNAVQTFLLAYANDGEGLPKVRPHRSLHNQTAHHIDAFHSIGLLAKFTR